MEFFKGRTAEIINYLFQSILVTYLILLLIEQIWQSSVSSYLNLNYFLIAVIIIGVLDVFSYHEVKKNEKATLKDYLFISVLGILGFIIIKFKTAQLGWLSWLISIIAGILIILLSFLVLEEDESEEYLNDKTDIHKNKGKISAKNKFIIKPIAITLFCLIALSLIIKFAAKLSFLESFRIVFGSVYVLFLPGFLISYIFFPETKEFDEDDNLDKHNNKKEDKKSGAIGWIERIALSFALSIAIVPLVVFYFNLMHIKINLLNSSLEILGILIISAVILNIKQKKK